uniref:Uncharacterized protein n=1 Tax=Ralstonia solanacearum TaxID=305 RepID=A0A0S4X491_RALSL|nr:protein of unknown function [Ralstonia solanacearum]
MQPDNLQLNLLLLDVLTRKGQLEAARAACSAASSWLAAMDW